MISKIVLLFLVFMAVLAMFGKFKLRHLTPKIVKRCPKCDRPKIGRGACPCGKKS